MKSKQECWHRQRPFKETIVLHVDLQKKKIHCDKNRMQWLVILYNTCFSLQFNNLQIELICTLFAWSFIHIECILHILNDSSWCEFCAFAVFAVRLPWLRYAQTRQHFCLTNPHSSFIFSVKVNRRSYSSFIAGGNWCWDSGHQTNYSVFYERVKWRLLDIDIVNDRGIFVYKFHENDRLCGFKISSITKYNLITLLNP